MMYARKVTEVLKNHIPMYREDHLVPQLTRVVPEIQAKAQIKIFIKMC